MLYKYIVVGVISVFFSCVSQILLKISADKKWDNHIKEYLNFFVITGYLILGLCLLTTIWVYSGLTLKLVTVLESLGYVFIMILSRVILKEKITRNKLIGNALIIIGIIIFNYIV